MATIDRQFRSSSPSQFFDDMVLADVVVPEGDPEGASIAVNDPGAPGLKYTANYVVYELSTIIVEAIPGVEQDTPPEYENRGWHADLRLDGARANSISAQLDNYFRKNPAEDVETPSNVKTKYDLHSEDEQPPPAANDLLIRQATPEGGTTMFDLKGQGAVKDAEFYERKSTFG